MPPKKNISHLINVINELPKNEDGIPLKKAFSPFTLPEMIPYYLLCQMFAPDNVVVKIAGEKLNDLFSPSLKGINIFDLMPASEKKFVSHLQQTMFSHPCGVGTKRRLIRASGMALPTITLSFPMISHDGKEKFFLMFYENEKPVAQKKPIRDKFSELSSYTHLQFIDIGKGIPSKKDFPTELPTLSLT